MPIDYARRLTRRTRTRRDDVHLSTSLAFVAGATNAGAYLAVNQYTSHMTGIVATMADALAIGRFSAVYTGIGALVSFIAGAATTAIMVNFARRRGLSSAYAQPLLLEAVLLLIFGLLGVRLHQIDGIFVPVTVMLLCFMMGLQNAVITKISDAVIRTTHVTGIVTDIGIELGKLVYVNRREQLDDRAVLADRDHLKILTLLLGAFFIGGVTGAWGFQSLGYLATVPLALILLAFAMVPVVDDVRNALTQDAR